MPRWISQGTEKLVKKLIDYAVLETDCTSHLEKKKCKIPLRCYTLWTLTTWNQKKLLKILRIKANGNTDATLEKRTRTHLHTPIQHTLLFSTSPFFFVFFFQGTHNKKILRNISYLREYVNKFNFCVFLIDTIWTSSWTWRGVLGNWYLEPQARI